MNAYSTHAKKGTAVRSVRRRGIVGAGGGGDDALAKLIAVNETEEGVVDVVAIGVGNHRSTFHKFLYSGDIQSLPHIHREVGAKRLGFDTRAATDAYITASLQPTAVRTFSIVSSTVVEDKLARAALGSTHYNSLQENRAVVAAIPSSQAHVPLVHGRREHKKVRRRWWQAHGNGPGADDQRDQPRCAVSGRVRARV